MQQITRAFGDWEMAKSAGCGRVNASMLVVAKSILEQTL